MLNKIYEKHQYRAAKQFLKNATVECRYSEPCVVNTTYALGGKRYFEHESRLESPHDDYYVTEIEASQ